MRWTTQQPPELRADFLYKRQRLVIGQRKGAVGIALIGDCLHIVASYPSEAVDSDAAVFDISAHACDHVLYVIGGIHDKSLACADAHEVVSVIAGNTSIGHSVE